MDFRNDIRKLKSTFSSFYGIESSGMSQIRLLILMSTYSFLWVLFLIWLAEYLIIILLFSTSSFWRYHLGKSSLLQIGPRISHVQSRWEFYDLVNLKIKLAKAILIWKCKNKKKILPFCMQIFFPELECKISR